MPATSGVPGASRAQPNCCSTEDGSSPAGRAELERYRTPLEYFERIYRERADPWGYESSAEDHAKYERTLAALDERRYRRALEVGCSIGVFTEMLATRCEALVALEPSASALARAGARLTGRPGIELVQGAVPEAIPAGPFDLVICSEVLYYLSEPLLLQTLVALERRLMAGGTLVAVHFRRAAPRGRLSRMLAERLSSRPAAEAKLSTDAVHELLRTRLRLKLTDQLLTERYWLDRFDDVA